MRLAGVDTNPNLDLTPTKEILCILAVSMIHTADDDTIILL